MGETSAEFYEWETSLGIARIVATSGGREPGVSSAKALGLKDINRSTSAWKAAGGLHSSGSVQASVMPDDRRGVVRKGNAG